MRWEPFFAPVTSGGHLPAWVPGEQSHVYPNAPVGEVFPGDPGISEAGFPSRHWIFDPRLGVAWQPKARTSVRAAFGMFSAPLQYTYWGHAGENAPFSPNYTLQATDPTISASYSHSLFNIPFDNPWANFAPTGGKSPFPPFQDPSHSPPPSTTFILPVGLGGPFDQHFTLPTQLAWNFSIQHNFKSDWLVSGAYVASETYHLADIVERNPGIYAAGGLRTLYPNFASVQVQESAATSSFESVQLSVEKRFSHGLQFQSNYTFSKTLDSATSGSIQFTGSVLDPFNLRNNKSWSGLYVPHTFKTNFVYQTPSLNGRNAFLRNVAGAWQLSGIWTWRTGQPFGIAGGCCDRNLTHINTRADYVPGQKVSWGGDRLNYFNTAAFQRSAPGSIGNTPRLFMFSPSIPAFDAGIAKNWIYRERYKLQFRWEAFNAFNHVVYGIPTTDIENSRYGQIFGLNNSPRLMQGALKLNF
jgi:hypothetical protein